MNIYHGLTTNVANLGNSPTDIAAHANLNWKACKVPLWMHGRETNVPYIPALAEGGKPELTANGKYANQRFAIVNCSNSRVIDGGKSVSDKFKLVDNTEILTDACRFATESGLSVARAGAIDGGRIVLVEAEVPQQYFLKSRSSNGLKVGDAISGGLTIVASHEPGRKTRGRAFMRRLVCLNGATVERAIAELSFSHRHQYGAEHKAKLREMMQRLGEKFGLYVDRVNQLVEVNASKLVQTAHVVQAVQPSLLAAVIEETVSRGIVAAGTSVARFVIDSLQSIDAVEGLLRKHIADTGKRALHKIIDSLDTQPGVEHCAGSVAQSYHAVTHYIDHTYGRKNNPGGAVEFSLMGKGDEIKENALNFGLQLVAVAR